MTKTLISAAIGCICLSAAPAPERATFVLTDGKRISGTLVFHTEQRNNFRPDTAEFNVGLDAGGERAIPVSQIVMIDFAGGRPQAAELQAIGDEPTLVMTDGSRRTGSLVDFFGGDTIRWKSANGRTEDVPVRNARRIYLQPARARTMFNIPAPRVPSSAPGTTLKGTVGDDGAFEVPANTQWVDTGISVRQGEAVRFITTGTVRIRSGRPAVSAEGDAAERRDSYPVTGMPGGSLIARIGAGAPFPLGQRADAVAMPGTGVLMLGINDDAFDDNSGAFRVAVFRRAIGENALQIPANQAWRDAGLTVAAGERLYFEVTGSVQLGNGQTADASGNSLRSASYPVPASGAGALVGRVGSSAPFLVGGGGAAVRMPAAGRLYLGINDDVVADNQGTFQVMIWR